MQASQHVFSSAKTCTDPGTYRRNARYTLPMPRTDQIDALMATLRVSLEGGDINAAHDVLSRLRKARDNHQLKPSKAQHDELTLAHRRLQELRNWRHWANNKRRQRLCKKMESLVDAKLHPDALLQALHEAQNEWKRLDEQEKLPGENKTTPASGQGLWHRFRRACNHAFNHIRPFLEKRTAVREDNLDAVKLLVADLERMASADDSLDVAKAARELTQARHVLSRLNELPPRKRGRMAKRLRAAMDTLKKCIRTENDVVVERKLGLIEEAEKLKDNHDTAAALKEAKALNQRWKKAGQLPHAKERKLWKALRRHLDPLFEHEAEAAQQRDAALAEERRHWLEICREAEQFASSEIGDPAQAEDQFKQLRTRWRTARVTDRKLTARFEGAQTRFRQRVATAHAQYRFEQIKSSFESALKKPGMPTDGKARDHKQDSAEPEILCLKLEMIAGIDSPPEAHKARMDLKVKQLNQVLRGERETGNDEQEFEAVLSELCEAMAKSNASSLQSRVKHSIEAFYGQRF